MSTARSALVRLRWLSHDGESVERPRLVRGPILESAHVAQSYSRTEIVVSGHTWQRGIIVRLLQTRQF